MDVTDNTGATSTVIFNGSNFMTQLNTALGSAASASFTGGVLRIGTNTSTDGIAITDNPSTPTNNAGSNFGQFFGLNNLIQSTQYANTSGSLTTASPNTFAPGGQLSLELTDSKGAAIRQINLTMPTTAAAPPSAT